MSGPRKTAIVTGASQGIGAGIVKAFVERGFNVVANSRKVTQSTEVAASDDIALVDGHIGEPATAARIVETALSRFKSIDVLVNNAGIMTLAPIADTDDASFDRHIAVNLKGTFNTLREAAKRLRAGGRIVNFSSSVVGLLMPTYGVYVATKAAVEGLTSVLAKELRGRNITVNAVAPGPTATDLFLKGKPQEVVDRLAKMAPLERLGQPGDIADVVSFLASSDAGWVNGQVLRVNGGLI